MSNEISNQKIREIPIWARRYAQNRTLGVIVGLIVFCAGAGVFAGLGLLIGHAWQTGNTVLMAVWGLVTAAFATFWLWFSFFGAHRFIAAAVERIYAREGQAAAGPAPEAFPVRMALPVAFVFMFCVLASVVLGLLGLLPIRLMQPVSALYCVPFMLYLAVIQPRTGSPFMLLWPALYALHAVLLVAGAPIYFDGPYVGLNMLIPVAGYGLLAALAGHIYSRYALSRLKAAAAPESK
jgi:hypothetical protein